MKKWKTNIIYSVFIVAALGSLIWWQSYNPAGFVTLSIQGMDNRITGDSVVEVIKIGEMYTSYEAVTTSGNENWTRFRGEQLDNISKGNGAFFIENDVGKLLAEKGAMTRPGVGKSNTVSQYSNETSANKPERSSFR
ncbi:MAG: hypothetical protein HN936_17840, partial [Bacteroidetes bacterium]|nr:hypothetical protein [Bacteroidota bacterium]